LRTPTGVAIMQCCPVDNYVATERDDSDNGSQQRRFSGTIWPDQAQPLTGPNNFTEFHYGMTMTILN
jgi:hypothetical protein